MAMIVSLDVTAAQRRRGQLSRRAVRLAYEYSCTQMRKMCPAASKPDTSLRWPNQSLVSATHFIHISFGDKTPHSVVSKVTAAETIQAKSPISSHHRIIQVKMRQLNCRESILTYSTYVQHCRQIRWPWQRSSISCMQLVYNGALRLPHFDEL